MCSLILAKIHMVTKQYSCSNYDSIGLILAKIHMVTKPCQWVNDPYAESYSSKNSYGNKTISI